jgi:hypothetical protein
MELSIWIPVRSTSPATPDYVCYDPDAIPVSWINWAFYNSPPGCNSSPQWAALVTNSYGYSDAIWYWGSGMQPARLGIFDKYRLGTRHLSDSRALERHIVRRTTTDLRRAHRLRSPGENGLDACSLPTSPYPPFDNIGTQQNPGVWQVTPGNQYSFDSIGYTSDAVDYYRGIGLAPCGTTIYQSMWISCKSGRRIFFIRTMCLEPRLTQTKSAPSANSNWTYETYYTVPAP